MSPVLQPPVSDTDHVRGRRDAPLTLQQVEIVKREFARVLTGMYHNRIDYPATSGGVTSEFASV